MRWLKCGALGGVLGLLLAASIGQTATAQDAAAYQKACGDCHPVPGAVARKIRRGTDAEKQAYLKEFLARHHTPDPEVIDQIIRYILEAPKQ